MTRPNRFGEVATDADDHLSDTVATDFGSEREYAERDPVREGLKKGTFEPRAE